MWTELAKIREFALLEKKNFEAIKPMDHHDHWIQYNNIADINITAMDDNGFREIHVYPLKKDFMGDWITDASWGITIF